MGFFTSLRFVQNDETPSVVPACAGMTEKGNDTKRAGMTGWDRENKKT